MKFQIFVFVFFQIIINNYHYNIQSYIFRITMYNCLLLVCFICILVLYRLDCGQISIEHCILSAALFRGPYLVKRLIMVRLDGDALIKGQRLLETHRFSVKFFSNFFSKCDQIRKFLGIWSRLLNKSLMGNLIFFAV